jgi:hypothetical protein
VDTEFDARPYGVPPPAFRLPDATTPGPVHLQVSDLARWLEYYQRVIGLHAERIADDKAVLTARGDNRPLVILRTRPGVTRGRRGAFGLYHFALLLPDRAALARFAAHLSAQNIQVGMADHLASEALYLWDPGSGVEPPPPSLSGAAVSAGRPHALSAVVASPSLAIWQLVALAVTADDCPGRPPLPVRWTERAQAPPESDGETLAPHASPSALR